MTNRLLSPNERMTDLFDRASTLNFTTIARVRGELTQERLEAALRKLEQRHPLLRAGIRRAGKQSRFEAGAGAPIPLVSADGTAEAWQERAELSMAHRDWPDDGPRAELTWLRHAPRDQTLLLCLHHVVSDGSSGMFAMRDLLAFAADQTLSSAAVPSPGQSAFLPASHRGWRSTLRAVTMIARGMRGDKPRRLHRPSSLPVEQRRPRVERIRLSRDESLALAGRARQAGATVHGVLCAAVAQGLAQQFERGTRQRVLHPVCLRRYTRELAPELPSPGEAVGCYVSSVETNHVIEAGTSLSTLARDFSEQVKQRKREGAPLLTAPIAGPLLTDRFMHKPVQAFRALAEGQLMLNTFSLSNLGRLENLGVRAQIGALTLEDLFFVAAGSVLSAFGASATSYGDELTLLLGGVEPMYAQEVTRSVAARVGHLLQEYARGSDET